MLDHLTDLSKATVLGYIFLAYLKNYISANELRRMAQAINLCFADDLSEFLKNGKAPYKAQAGWVQGLLTSGLAEPVGDGTIGGAGNIYYEVSALGQKLYKAYVSARNMG